MAALNVILKEHGLRKTAFRLELLDLFMASKATLTVEEIKLRMGSAIDKVTIYRALEAFEKNGLIHKVPDKCNLTRYALCHVGCSAQEHVHHHAHLICNQCSETFCVEGVNTPELQEVNGFVIQGSNLTLEGVCPDCNQRDL